jgi:DNA-binding MarR family transcriptional regulator
MLNAVRNKLHRVMSEAAGKLPEDRPSLRLERFLPYRLSVLSNTISRALAEAYAERYGLSINEWRVMAILGRFPGSSAAEVADRAAMDKVAVSRAVSRLLEAGRIRRRTAPDDRRRSVLLLSPAGRRIFRRLTPVLLEYEDALLSSLSDGERAQLDRILSRLTDEAAAIGPPRLD